MVHASAHREAFNDEIPEIPVHGSFVITTDNLEFEQWTNAIFTQVIVLDQNERWTARLVCS